MVSAAAGLVMSAVSTFAGTFETVSAAVFGLFVLVTSDPLVCVCVASAIVEDADAPGADFFGIVL